MAFQILATKTIFPVFGLLGFLVMVILFPMLLRVRNTISCLYTLYIMWTSLSCLIYGVNSIVWNNNMVDWAPVWCYISFPLLDAAAVGNPAVLLCIVRRLYLITTLKNVNQSNCQNRRDLIIEICIGVAFPLLLSSLLYLVEFRRYYILENIGCFPAVAFTPLTIPLFFVWPSILGLLNTLYAGLTIRATIRQKAYKRKIIQDNQYVQFDHYWRLLVLSGICIICTLPFGLMILVVNLLEPLTPYKWNSVHAHYSQIEQLPVAAWASNARNQLAIESSRWFAVFYALVFFAFFGFTKDARQKYRLAGHWVTRRLGFCSSNSDTLRARKLSLPIYLTRRGHVVFPSKVFLGSLKFNYYAGSNQIIASIAQSSDFSRLSLPIFSPDLSIGEVWCSHTGGPRSRSVTVSGNEAALSSVDQGLARSAHHDEHDHALSLPITELVPTLDASVILWR